MDHRVQGTCIGPSGGQKNAVDLEQWFHAGDVASMGLGSELIHSVGAFRSASATAEDARSWVALPH